MGKNCANLKPEQHLWPLWARNEHLVLVPSSKKKKKWHIFLSCNNDIIWEEVCWLKNLDEKDAQISRNSVYIKRMCGWPIVTVFQPFCVYFSSSASLADSEQKEATSSSISSYLARQLVLIIWWLCDSQLQNGFIRTELFLKIIGVFWTSNEGLFFHPGKCKFVPESRLPKISCYLYSKVHAHLI